MATQAAPPNSAFLAPKHWPTWLGLALLGIIVWLPFRVRMAIGAWLGGATWLLGKERRYITEVNIRLCFPELSASEQADLVYQSFLDNGIGLVETVTGWLRPAEHFRDITILEGTEAFEAAQAQGRGLLLMGAHYSTLDFGANLMSLYYPFAVTYRAHKNPLFDAYMLRGRVNNCNGVFDRKDVRGAFRHLKQGKILWYAPDQDYGPEQAVYAPFFGQTAATITAGSRFAAINNSPVYMVSQRRLNNEQRYVLEYTPFPAGFPTGDDVEDATLVNRMIETQIRKAPAQYLWMHKRFKTQPGGKPASPYIYIKTPKRKLSESKYQQLITGASALPDHGDRLLLASGLQLWIYPGLARGFGSSSHPALQLDRLSKLLRSNGIATVTCDSIFTRALNKTTAVTVYALAGQPLTPATNIAPAVAAQFLFDIHQCGCSFKQLQASDLYFDGTRPGIADPLILRNFPGTAAQLFRYQDLLNLLQLLAYSPVERAAFISSYLSSCNNADRKALADRLAHAPVTEQATALTDDTVQ